MSPAFKQLILSGLSCVVMVAISGCGGGESAPEAGVLSPSKKQAPGGAVDSKTGTAAPAGGAAAEKK